MRRYQEYRGRISTILLARDRPKPRCRRNGRLLEEGTHGYSCLRFQAGARTHWHTHPLGQTLAVISGCGRVQVWGGKAREIRPGDVVWIPPGEKHWHGAGPNTVMVHVAMQEALDGKHVEWMEPVTDEQYKSAG